MKSPSDALSPLPKGNRVKLGKRLARLKWRLLKALSGHPGPGAAGPSQDQEFWSSVLTRKKEQECPARDFLHVSSTLRKAGNLSESENICARGIAIYPLDLPLAIEHAEIAKALKDQQAGMARWQRVLELGGNMAPVTAFKNLADCLRSIGSFDEAEQVLRRGLEVHQNEFSLMDRLALTLSASANSARALAAWEALIDAHPNKNQAGSYLQICLILRGEGLLDRAEEALRSGLTRYPDDTKLLDSIAELSFLRDRPSLPLKCCDLPPTFTAHLFQDRFKRLEKGTLGFSSGINSFKQNVPAMLGFTETVSPLQEPGRVASIDVFAIWGPPSDSNASVINMAASHGKPLLCLDSGFLSTPDIEGKDTPTYSVVICPDSIYFDATQPSYSENILNSDEFGLTKEQQVRAETCIESIVSRRISKYNHAPRIDMRQRFPMDGTKRILLVDQRSGGGTIHWSLGGRGTFERMWDAALALPDHEILVKLHPEAISGRHRSHLRPLAPDPLPRNVTIIDFDVNPFDLFDVVDQVFVCTSQLGFEAAMAGKEVHCFGAPFYSGWGFTHDRIAIPRRKKRRTITEIFHLFYIVQSRYFVPGLVEAEIEDLITYLDSVSNEPPASTGSNDIAPAPPPLRISSEPLKILMVIPSGRHGASGRYLQNLAVSLIHLGCKVMILAEGPCQRFECGVRWLTLEFDGLRLAESVRRQITDFAPHFIYENGVRSRSQRAALEAMALTNARFAMQSEDDDVQVHQHRCSEKAAEDLVALDRPELTSTEIARFLRNHDWDHSLQIFLDPGFNRWIEPLLRVACYRLASLHTAIWHPFAERLFREYGVPTLVVPPVAASSDFERMPLTREERETVLRRYDIDLSTTVIFIGGALYSYSREFLIFLNALNLAARKTAREIALVVASGRSSLPLGQMARERLDSQISFIDLGEAVDEIYLEMLKACDVICSPGVPDTFNRYRLPSRLVKAMAMAKPILTCRCGFGESLEHGINAFLMDGEDPDSWATSIALCLDPDNRSRVGYQGLQFAREHFDSNRAAAALKERFQAILATPERTLATGITLTPNEPSSSHRLHPSIRFQDRCHSSMQFAIRTIASLTHRLDTVVHLGAGRCDEFVDYCRLGAHTILLVEALEERVTALRELENTNGRILVKQAVVSGGPGNQTAFIVHNSRSNSEHTEDLWLQQPDRLLEQMPSTSIAREFTVTTSSIAEVCEGVDLASKNNLLLLELNGAEATALASTPPLLLQKFRWIALRAQDLPLCHGGTSPADIHRILKAAGFEFVIQPLNHANSDILMLFRLENPIPDFQFVAPR